MINFIFEQLDAKSRCKTPFQSLISSIKFKLFEAILWMKWLPSFILNSYGLLLIWATNYFIITEQRDSDMDWLTCSKMSKKRSISMNPYIKGGDWLIEKCYAHPFDLNKFHKEFKKGDIAVFFEFDNGKLVKVIHRFIGSMNGELVFKGDNNDVEEIIVPSFVVGKIVARLRKPNLNRKQIDEHIYKNFKRLIKK
jgi:hypothetical protein